MPGLSDRAPSRLMITTRSGIGNRCYQQCANQEGIAPPVLDFFRKKTFRERGAFRRLMAH